MGDEKRVLVVASLGTGGVSNLMTNIQKRINRNELNFDYLVFHDEKPFKADVVTEMGSKIYVASTDSYKIRAFRRLFRLRKIWQICKKNKIQYLHYNSDFAADFTNILAAKLGGVKMVTMHAHNSSYTLPGVSVKISSFLLKPLLPIVVDNFWACSNLAGQFMFPKRVLLSERYKMVPNGIETNKFDYDKKKREEMRQKLDVEGKYVIGHAGRFVHQKNHKFLIDVFKCIQEIDSDAVFLLYGTGELLDEIKEYSQKNNVNVRFMGVSGNMNEVWQAMDVFVMPSFHEGLPVSGIEAQTSGLRCVFSDTITREVDVSGTSRFLSLNESADKWAEEIISMKNYERKSFREEMLKKRYDIQQLTETFEKYYMSI